jgi:hypothetical protein
MPPAIRNVEKVSGCDDGLVASEVLQPRKTLVIGIFQFNLFRQKNTLNFKKSQKWDKKIGDFDFVVIGFIFLLFGMLYQEKSGTGLPDGLF